MVKGYIDLVILKIGSMIKNFLNRKRNGSCVDWMF